MSQTQLSNLQTLSRSSAESTVPVPPSRWKTRILLPSIILAAILGMLLWSSLDLILPATQVQVMPVVVKDVEGQSGTVTVQAPGWIEPDPHPYFATALADGIVEEVLVLEGDLVQAGQVVVRMVDEDARLDLQRAEAELQQARAELDIALANQRAAHTVLETLIERRRQVAVTEAMLKRVEGELSKLQADIAVEQAKLAALQDEYDRKSQLVESRAVSEAAIARLALQLDAQRALTDATKAQKPILESQRLSAQADLDAAQEHKRLLVEEQREARLADAATAQKRAAVALAEARRDTAALTLDRMQVRTPVSGVVMRRFASPGSRLMRSGEEYSAHAVHVYDPAHLQVRVDVPLADAARITVGQRAEITVEALPDHVFQGSLTRIVHRADIAKNTVEVKVRIDDPTDSLTPDMLARVRLLGTTAKSTGEMRQRVFAPRSLLHDTPNGTSVMVATGVINGRGRAAFRTIERGTTTIGDWIEISAGLQPGDLLIADASGDLEDGERIQITGEATAGIGDR